MNEEKTKNCSKCGKLKALSEYCALKQSKDGKRPSCKECDYALKKIYRQNHKKEAAVINKKYRQANRDKLIQYSKEWYAKNLKDKGANSDNQEYYTKYRNRVNEKQRERLKIDVSFKMKRNIGRMMRKFFQKDRATYDIIGCDSDMFHEWMVFQSKFYDIDLDNDKYHIDHVIPCAAYDLSIKANQFKCFNWSNLRPIYYVDNIVKSDDIDDELIRIQEHRMLVFLILHTNQFGSLDMKNAISYQESLRYRHLLEITDAHQGNDLGHGNNAKNWVIRSQAPKQFYMSLELMEKVQRLYGSGSLFRSITEWLA